MQSFQAMAPVAHFLRYWTKNQFSPPAGYATT
jgi:hypothetical protein